MPTWNYEVVHAHGRLTILDDERFVRGLLARLTRHHEAAEPKPAAPKPPEAGPAKFTLQLSAFQDQAEADAFLATVKAAGYGAYVTSADVDGKKFFRVRLGKYPTYEDAVAAKAEFEKKVPKIAYVIRL